MSEDMSAVYSATQIRIGIYEKNRTRAKKECVDHINNNNFIKALESLAEIMLWDRELKIDRDLLKNSS